jgi:hypothetical protein
MRLAISNMRIGDRFADAELAVIAPVYNRYAFNKGLIRRRVLAVQRLTLGTILLFVMTASAGAAPQSSAASSPVWYWFQNCGENTTLGVEVVLDGKVVYRSSFPICKVVDVPKTSDRQPRILAFRFKGGHLFQSRSIQTSSAQTIEGNIWQAGIDPDDLILGVSFATKKQILLNTIYFAQPSNASTSEVDRGIVVKTFPVPRK